MSEKVRPSYLPLWRGRTSAALGCNRSYTPQSPGGTQPVSLFAPPCHPSSLPFETPALNNTCIALWGWPWRPRHITTHPNFSRHMSIPSPSGHIAPLAAAYWVSPGFEQPGQQVHAGAEECIQMVRLGNPDMINICPYSPPLQNSPLAWSSACI